MKKQGLLKEDSLIEKQYYEKLEMFLIKLFLIRIEKMKQKDNLFEHYYNNLWMQRNDMLKLPNFKKALVTITRVFLITKK